MIASTITSLTVAKIMPYVPEAIDILITVLVASGVFKNKVFKKQMKDYLVEVDVSELIDLLKKEENKGITIRIGYRKG